MKKFLWILLLSLLFFSSVNAACDDPPGDGVDYSGCAFSDGQDLTGTYLANANFDGANLNNTTWAEGKKCGLNSIGECKVK